MLTRLAQQAGVAEQDVIGLLRAYGRTSPAPCRSGTPTYPASLNSPPLNSCPTLESPACWNTSRTTRWGTSPSAADLLAGVQDKSCSLGTAGAGTG